MRRMFHRVISVGIALSLVAANVIISLAATPSGSSEGTGIYNPGNWPGYGDNPTPSNDHWGVRLSVTNMSQAGTSGITPIELGDSYTAAINQFNDLGELLKKKVWMPGDYGLKVIKLGKVNSLS